MKQLNPQSIFMSFTTMLACDRHQTTAKADAFAQHMHVQ